MDRHVEAEHDRLGAEQDRLDTLWEQNAYRVREAIREGSFATYDRRANRWDEYQAEVTERINGNELMRLYVSGDFDGVRRLIGEAVAKELEAFYELTFDEDADEE